jgi:hypothetical protein
LDSKDGLASLLDGSNMRFVDLDRIVRTGGSPDLVKFATALDRPPFEDDPLAFTNEWMWARSLGRNQYEVENILFSREHLADPILLRVCLSPMSWTEAWFSRAC